MLLPTLHTSRRRRLVLGLAASCTLAIPASASAAFPGTNGPIAFDRGGSILTTPLAGGATKTLSASGYDFAPSFSRDGRKVVYAVNRDIWVSNADGTGKRQLTTDGEFNSDPAFSPDGTKVVYSGGAHGNSELYAVPVAGGAATRLTITPDNDEHNPAYSPDGRRIAYERTGCDTPHGGGVCVYVMDASGAGARNLTPENRVAGCESQPGYYFNGASREPSWSPDGTTIAFAGPTLCSVTSIGMDIWLVNTDGSGKRNLNRDDATNDRQPAFSPDGSRIAFMSDRSKTGLSIYTMGTDGGAVTRVTTGDNDRRPDWAPAAKKASKPRSGKSKLRKKHSRKHRRARS